LKVFTRDQVAARKAAAVRFLENVIGDPDRADEVADESLESYASRRHFQIANDNPQRRNTTMAGKKNPDTMTKSELLDYVSDLEDTLDSIADLASSDDDSSDDDEDDGGPGDSSEEDSSEGDQDDDYED
jgi:hypothetical protein